MTPDLPKRKIVIRQANQPCPLKARAIDAILGKCNKTGCQELAARGKSYCSKQHAPFAHLPDPRDGTDV